MAASAQILGAGVSLARRRVLNGKGRRAAAQPDEDAVTLAVEAAAAALPEALSRPASLVLAGTTLPYLRGGSVQPLAELLGIHGDLFALEMTATARDGLAAMRMAAALARQGEGPVLLCAVHAPDPGERRAGAGAVALLIGQDSEAAMAEFAPAGASTEELRDTWQLESGSPARSADRSFVAEIGTERPARLLLAKVGKGRGAVLVDGPDARAAAAVEKAFGGPGDRVAPLVGNLGAAHLLLRILLELEGASFATAIADGLVEAAAVTPGPRAAAGMAAATTALEGGEEGMSPPRRQRAEDFRPYASAPRSWRERDTDLRLRGIVGRAESDPVPGRKAPTGKVVTWVRDHVYPAAPVTDMAVVQLDDGGRHFGQVAMGEEVAIGDRVRLVPRRLHEGGDVVQYFWKVAPCR